MNAQQLTIKLYWDYRSSSQLLIPRFTPRHWWECDLWRLTKAGYSDEFEIKLTVADFRADIKKERSQWIFGDKVKGTIATTELQLKHQLLEGNSKGPNRFWFVMPEEVSKKVVIPDYAGLIVWTGHRLTTIKRAPDRHKQKWDGDLKQILWSFHGRYWAHQVYREKEFTAVQG